MMCFEIGYFLSCADTFKHLGCKTGLYSNGPEDTFLLVVMPFLGFLAPETRDWRDGFEGGFDSGSLFSLSATRLDC